MESITLIENSASRKHHDAQTMPIFARAISKIHLFLPTLRCFQKSSVDSSTMLNFIEKLDFSLPPIRFDYK